MRIEEVGEGRYDIGVAFTAMDSAYRLALKTYFEKNEQPRSKLRGIEGKGDSRAEYVGWVEARSAETHRLERWVSLTLNPSYAFFAKPRVSPSGLPPP